MIRVADIQRTVARHYGIPAETMRDPAHGGEYRRLRKYAHPRQVAMCLSRRLTEHSTVRIGHFFGGRDHSTVITGSRQAERREPITLRRLAAEILQEAGR